MPQNGFSLGKFGGKAGLIVIGLGLLAIGIGANGTRSQLSVIAQVPYIVTGGIFGISLVIVGAALLIVQGAREDRALLEAKLDLLAEAMLEGAGRSTRSTTPGDLSGLVVAGTASYHTPGCRLVDGREETSYLTPGEARERGLKACRVCQPELAAPDVTVR